MAKTNAAEKRKMPEGAVIVDISSDEGAAGPEKIRKKDKKKRKNSKLKIFLVLLILFLALASAVFIIMKFDFFGARAAFFQFVHNLDPEYQALSDMRQSLEEWEGNLTQIQEDLYARDQALDDMETGLLAREKELAEQEAGSNPVYRPPVNDEDVAYMKNIGKIYAEMEPKNAADIMAKLYSVEDMAAIIYYMPQTGAASILELMDAKVAAQITDKLLHG